MVSRSMVAGGLTDMGLPRPPIILSAQALTALGATTSQNQTTAFGGHTGAETMATSADEVRWLKRAFHGCYSWRTTALIEKKFERALLQSAWRRVNLCTQAETSIQSKAL
jgi:hypothetical protein